MKIERFEVIGLFGRENRIFSRCNDDLNILTGRNGAGKTSLLKLLWYVMSGNIFLALKEVNFQRILLTTDKYECIITRTSKVTCKVDLNCGGVQYNFEDLENEEGDVFENAEDMANPIIRSHGSSVFFPTFRRIEGGFSIDETRPGIGARGLRAKSEVEEALVSLSRKLSNDPHMFVSSISTVDIVGILMRRYTDLSENYNNVQQKTSQEIIETIKAFKSDKTDVTQIDAANNVLDQIRTRIENMETEREQIMTPIDAVRKLVTKLFHHTGIKIGSRLSFGDAASAVSSDSLSAGEKQMLSFICYNAFYKNSVIFIDEPELSLHVDWQRQLFPVLLGQQSSNQFIIATHSPFIYSKYPDKEIIVDSDRGDAESN